MAYGLASSREQLQWHLIYAGKNSYSGLDVSADYFNLFNQRSVPSLRTQTTETDATTDAQSIGPH